MRLSIIIPVYNVEKYIAKCMDSLLDQGLVETDYEIIIVNDGSTDDSLKIAQSYANANDHIVIIDKENAGAGSARNSGLDRAKGKYIYFIDSDDFIISNCLKELLKNCEQYNLDILTFLSKSHSDKSLKGKSLFGKKDFSSLFLDNKFSPIVNGEEYVANVSYRSEVWWFMINREFLKSSGKRFVEGRWLEDVVFTIELILKAKRIAHLHLDVHRYRVTPGSAMNSREAKHYVKIIRDMQKAAIAFDPIIKKLEHGKSNPDCIIRVKTRQQSFVFFAMIRMFRSTMSLDEIKQQINQVRIANAYPLDSFLGEEYNGFKYQFLVKLFNNERRFYFCFKILNPILKFKNK